MSTEEEQVESQWIALELKPSRNDMRVAFLLCALLTIGCGGGTTGAGGPGGSTGTGGTTGMGGRGGSTGAGGTSPCSGSCSNPITVPPNTNSSDLGTGATCHEVAGDMGSMTCGNFVAPRTFTVNGMMFDCMAGLAGILPEARNGGWCFQASAGSSSYAYFTTYNVR